MISANAKPWFAFKLLIVVRQLVMSLVLRSVFTIVVISDG